MSARTREFSVRLALGTMPRHLLMVCSPKKLCVLSGIVACAAAGYANGQVILLSEQDLLLVISKEGQLVLLPASPDKHTEIARFQALEGKTWNHPVIVGDVLLVGNGQEMAAFRLPPPNR